jgi:hypothetical protein
MNMIAAGLDGAAASGGEEEKYKFQKQGGGFDLMSILSGQQGPFGGPPIQSPNNRTPDPNANSRFDMSQLLSMFR